MSGSEVLVVGRAPQPYLAHLHTVTTLGSTVPANGDVNPYGLIRVTSTIGALHAVSTGSRGAMTQPAS